MSVAVQPNAAKQLQGNGEAPPVSLLTHQRELSDAARQLATAARATFDDVALASRLQLERNPYLTLASFFALGYVLGGGVPVRAVRFALGMGVRMGATMAMRELASRAYPGARRSARPRPQTTEE
jgi:hypothetical protein